MSEASVAARKAMKAKISRITSATNPKVDASDYSVPESLDTEAKVGMRPLSRRAYKRGGKVIDAITGSAPEKNMGRKARASGGTAYENRNLKELNNDRAGIKHVGGFASGGNAGDSVPKTMFNMSGGQSMLSKAAGLKKGGRAKRADGGGLSGLSPYGLLPMLMGAMDKKKDGGNGPSAPSAPALKAGGRATRATGGRAKGKTNINIIIGHGGGQQPAQGAPQGVTPPLAGPPQLPPQKPALPQAAPPPMAAPAGAPPAMAPPPQMAMDSNPHGMPPASAPMMRKSGGRTTHTIDNAAGGGLGRLQKAKLY